MQAVWLWLHIVRRRFFPLWWPLILTVLALFGSLWVAEKQRQDYLTAYRAEIQTQVAKNRQSPAQDKDSLARRQKLQREHTLSFSSPTTYLAAYLSTLKAYGKTPAAMRSVDDTGHPIAAVKTPEAVLRNAAFSDPNVGELYSAMTELTLVQQNALVPMMPARLLANEHTDESQTPLAILARYQSLSRFYEYGWYQLQNLVEQDAGLILIAVLTIVFSLGFTFQRQAATKQNVLLQLTGVREERNLVTSFLLVAVSEVIAGLAVLGGFILSSYLINGPGSFNYPIQEWQHSYALTFVPLYRMLGRELLLLGLAMLLLTAVVFALTACFGKLIAAIGGSLVVMLLGLIAPTAWWSPFTYFHVHRIADRYALVDVPITASSTPTVPQSLLTGCLVLLGWTVIILGAAVIVTFWRGRKEHQ
ncbi:hypothetical protein [Lacticaseibacillus absianus]|uniref:hypothetical protein n=1 Tax=Lacticaseibacillus absianus TaxID=2729623 RepID=UPI0015CEF38B|nr:hypothetical protein [Lacticaseibacillus absianus]